MHMSESDKPKGSGSAQESPNSSGQPTFDQLPPPGFNKAVAEQQKRLSEATGISVEDIQKYEKMSEEESQE